MTARQFRAVGSTSRRLLQALPPEVRNEIVYLRVLVRDASRLLNEAASEDGNLGWWSDVKDWHRSAVPFVKE